MSWKTWSPFQSKIVKEICVHMTEIEKKEVIRMGRMYGLWVALTFAIPLSFIFATMRRPIIPIFVALIVVPIFIIGTRGLRRKQKKFLCSTEWAKSKGYTPDRI
ncbi:hypothetical protein KKC91_03845 [bacterium]|nr:hypothetical protein [bacterium]